MQGLTSTKCNLIAFHLTNCRPVSDSTTSQIHYYLSGQPGGTSNISSKHSLNRE